MSEETKRFDPIEKAWCGGEMSGTMKEDPEGDWVRYEDLTCANATIAELREELQQAHNLNNLTTENCDNAVIARDRLTSELESVKRERDEARFKCDVAILQAHRACCSEEHDPANGKIHGFCVVCGVPWPCDYSKPKP